MSTDYADKPLEKPLKLVLKVGGSEVTELSGSGHDSSYYDDRSDHERERHKEKKKKKKKKSEKEKHLDDEERRKRKVSEGGRNPWGAGGARASWPAEAEASVLFLGGCAERRLVASVLALCASFLVWPLGGGSLKGGGLE